MSDGTDTAVEDFPIAGAILSIDPRKVGPMDIVRAYWSALKRFASNNAPYLIGASVILVGAAWHYGISIPTLPNWTLVMLLSSAVAAPCALVVGWKLSRALYGPDTVLLSVQNPMNGDQRLVHLAPDRFSEMTVENHNGEERDRGFLHEVYINGSRAYEVDSYDPDRNHAIASWQAGVSNSEIRSKKQQIKRIKTSLEQEADKARQLLIHHPDILREQSKETANHLIRVVEGVEVPEGEQLHDRLSEVLDESDPSEDLLEGIQQYEHEPEEQRNGGRNGHDSRDGETDLQIGLIGEDGLDDLVRDQSEDGETDE